MKISTKTSRLLAVLACLCVLIGGGEVGYNRIRNESRNRAVGTVMDYKTILDITAGTAYRPEVVLDTLKASGLTAVAVSEETLQDLIDRQRVRVYTPFISSLSNRVIVYAQESGDAGRIISALEDRGYKEVSKDWEERKNKFSGIGFSWGPPVEFQIDLPYGYYISPQNLPLGVDPEVIIPIKSAGLDLVVRQSNFPGTSANPIDANADYYLPLGEEVIGNRDKLNTTADYLTKKDIKYLSIEFTNIAGDAKLASMIPERTIRLHSIQQAEINKLTLGAVLDRLTKAFSERNVRFLFIRPFSTSSDGLKSVTELLAKLRERIRKEGGDIKSPQPFSEQEPAKLAPYLIGLGILFASLAVGSLLSGPKWVVPLAGAIGLGVAGASAVGAMASYVALFGALIFPILAFLWTENWKVNGIVKTLAVTSIGVLGGLVVFGTLNGLDTMLKLQVFAGIKVAHFAPIIIIGVILLSRIVNFKDLWNEPLRYGSVILGVLTMVVLLFLMSRTGNDNPASVSDMELQLRSILDRVFGVRPRTKEFMLGHPLLVVGYSLWNLNQPKLRGWGALCITAGFIGVTSAVNTFCHLHTPLMLTIQRVGIGLVLGVVIGGILWVVVKKFAAKVPQTEQS